MDTDLSGLTVVSNCKRHQVKVLRHLFFWLEAYLSAVVSQMDHPLSAWKQESTAMSRLWTALHRLFQKKTSAGNSNSKAQKVHVLYSEAANCRRKSFQTRIFSMWFQEQCPKSGRDHVLSHNSLQLKRFSTGGHTTRCVDYPVSATVFLGLPWHLPWWVSRHKRQHQTRWSSLV